LTYKQEATAKSNSKDPRCSIPLSLTRSLNTSLDQIRNAIFGRRLKPADKLPSERELIGKFKVSKATLREALGSLEVLGFLEIRKGVSGGAFVTGVDMVKARDSFTNFLLFKNLSLEDLSEVRLLLESYIAEKATLGITQ